VAARIPAGRALATVFVDRSFDVLALILFLTVSLPFVSNAEWLRRIAIGGLVLLVLLGLVLVVARMYTHRWTRERRRHRGLLRRVARDTIEGLADPIGRLRAAALVGVSLVTWTMWALSAWSVGRAVDLQMSFVEALFVTAVINLGVAIPSSPGFVGTYQWLAVSALALFGVGTESALAFAILMHAIWYVPTTLVGSVLLVRRSLRRGRSAARSPKTAADKGAQNA
jgi:uncharacterized protein (TIRG00374 family)